LVKVFLVKLAVVQLFKKCPTSHGARRLKDFRQSRSSLSWDVRQRRLTVDYQCFGTASTRGFIVLFTAAHCWSLVLDNLVQFTNICFFELHLTPSLLCLCRFNSFSTITRSYLICSPKGYLEKKKGKITKLYIIFSILHCT
jgi:hypothetical protein